MTASPTAPAPRPRLAKTFWLGLGLILICECFLFTDVYCSHRGPLRSQADFLAVAPPEGTLANVARWFAINMTALAWPCYLVLAEGLLVRLGSNPVRRRPHHFALLCLASVFIWCVFDWVNFWIFAPHRAWEYIGIPAAFSDRLGGYLLAFGCIVPGMLMSGQILMDLHVFDWARSSAWRLPRWGVGVALFVGVGMTLWPLARRDPVTNYTLWTSLVFLLDPINLLLGRPSMLRDWQNGWYGRTLAALAGGLMCGFLWEFWNYWAVAKWIYHLPFLGRAEHYRYFEMPLPGLLGFLPFGMECWVMWQVMRIPLDGLAEPLPDERSLL